MVQIALIAVSIGLIILGVKAFTPSGLAFSSSTTLHGKQAKVVGVMCIIAGICLIPALWLAISYWSGR